MKDQKDMIDDGLDWCLHGREWERKAIVVSKV